MKRTVIIDDGSVELKLERAGENWKFSLDTGVAGELSAIEVEPGVYSVLWGTKSFQVRLGSFVELEGRRFHVTSIDPRELSSTLDAVHGSGPVQLEATMPGKVIRLLAVEGDTVEAGQGIIVVEAMKMQNEMRAPKPGRISSIRVSAGDAVAAGQLLAVIE